jgi:hypothetical protein
MKKIFFSALAISTILFAACNNGDTKKENQSHDMEKMNMDSTKHATTADDTTMKVIAVTYPGVDTKLAASINAIADHYLHIKNALANDNGAEAANGAKAMEAIISKLDKSLFTAEQKTAYDQQEEKLKENAAAIAGKADKIKEQRLQFATLSEAVYGLVKSFGAGRPLYHDHCPMARDNQGAMWLSEVKEVKNPYFGAAMPTCGSVEEMIE